MDANQLRALQAPLKKRYREQPETARISARAEAMLDLDRVTYQVRSWAGETAAGLHPAAGGDGSLACSADMLFEALVACAGVTISAVATAMGVSLRGGRVIAEAHWGRARHARRRPRDPDRSHRHRADLRIGYRRRCGDGAAARGDQRTVLRHHQTLRTTPRLSVAHRIIAGV
jgi:hypothetical protein